MRLALGADHAGVTLKAAITRLLDDLHIEHRDFGTSDETSVDYPDYAELVGRAVADGEADAGILICGTGIGMAMAANKIPGVRAAPVTDLESARLAREHNNANVLALGARVTPPDRALDIVRVFVETPFAGGRHERRIRKITALEQQAANELADEMPGR
jgi:ribose 5-phosphate isomerase B